MQNLFETVKKAQMVVQVEAVRVQKELAAYVLSIISIFVLYLYSFCQKSYLSFAFFSSLFSEQSLMVIVKVS